MDHNGKKVYSDCNDPTELATVHWQSETETQIPNNRGTVCDAMLFTHPRHFAGVEWHSRQTMTSISRIQERRHFAQAFHRIWRNGSVGAKTAQKRQHFVGRKVAPYRRMLELRQHSKQVRSHLWHEQQTEYIDMNQNQSRARYSGSWKECRDITLAINSLGARVGPAPPPIILQI